VVGYKLLVNTMAKRKKAAAKKGKRKAGKKKRA